MKLFLPTVGAVLLGAAVSLGTPAGVSMAFAANKLVIGQTLDPTGFDPTKHTNSVFHHQVYDTLVSTDAGGKVYPQLATSWERSADNLTVTFKLRPSKFHTGRDVTADDVVFTIKRYQDQSVGANLYERLKTITDIRAVDPQTVEFKLSETTPGLFDLLNDVFIQNKDVVDQFNKKDAGSGRFAINSWTPGQPLLMERFADHWDNANTKLDEVEVRTMPDQDASASALQAGEVDMLLQADYTTVDQFRDVAGFKVVEPDMAPWTVYLALNTSRKPFDNQLFRQAISYAMDRQKMVEIAFGGNAEATCQPWAKSHWAYDPTLV